MSENRLKRTISSALWAAYGDALGFPTELASENLVRERLGQPRATRTEQWKRLVGGRFGAQVSLPAGAYSDDTQLRLSTSRAISGQGYFDVEAFAKIELPIWLVYALGAGRGSKAAASSLCNRGTNWFSNFFNGYEHGGGNGAAMRVQPHVWAASDLGNKPSYLLDVIRNAICTHGHMRGIAGAVVHAVSLAYVLEFGRVPGETEWLQFADDIKSIPSLIRSDSELATFWAPTWEKSSKQSLQSAVDEVAAEWEASVRNAVDWLANRSLSPAELYASVVSSDKGLSNEERGSGLKCALFANVAALLGQRVGSQEIIEQVVNLFNSDTDTIATMAGALIGAAHPESQYLGEIQDEAYIQFEAKRLYAISQGTRAESFTYPDMLYWQAPRAVIDSLTETTAGLELQGLGKVAPIGNVYSGKQKAAAWQWFSGNWGQTVLIRHRRGLTGGQDEPAGDTRRVAHPVSNTVDMFDEPHSAEPVVPVVQVAEKKERVVPARHSHSEDAVSSPALRQADHPRDARVHDESESHTQADELDIWERADVQAPDLDALTNEAIKTFDPTVIGQHLLDLAERPNGVYLTVAYSSIIAKARIARLRHKRREHS
ncbi:ADP-ribosylglycohydrolase [Pseudomonas savastanoi pv. fraxini]|uniref:ADP-ribosylation/Crystallin J1 n=2 Tax=Pseudomonas TaxID=286 RepID=A0AB74BRG2_PSESS|nr:ADP-ribosylglycohydrolase family protein [Pseudomonas savastanoi]KPY68271.1 ADP-ribosylation/Crystallin J1 [Pseudomonas savastanoi pv. savastanoi]KUG41140.1 ADP-ribosylation/Crystallin J1 [Pseudomonas savastanoi pv. fraxini]RMT82103.1 ADP-ribosylation/Crystallin J1 [Pseudomonas savastanoi pv. nerii]TSC35175.1 ADP-ribosylglycohydrolase family protein [Pseudomonas sp. ST1]